jgi:hypothetical protein
MFLCSSLERGKDGVGDYTMTLAEVMTNIGVSVAVVALNDCHVETVTETTADLPSGISVVRIPSSMPWEERVAVVGDSCSAFRPDWISLQFVCFGLQPKGLVQSIVPHISRMTQGVRCHWMFHELWAGMGHGAPIRHKVLGLLQRGPILELYRAVSPRVTHTSNEAYQRYLYALGIPSIVLPIFGSIPVLPPSGWLSRELVKLSVGNNPLVLGLFGAVPPAFVAAMRGWIPMVRAYSEPTARRVVIVGVGRCNKESWKEFEQEVLSHFPQITIVHLGEQSRANISDFLSCIRACIATCQRSLMQKSSVVGACRDHGTPVIVPRTDDDCGSERKKRLAELNASTRELFAIEGQKIVPHGGAISVGEALLTSLR